MFDVCCTLTYIRWYHWSVEIGKKRNTYIGKIIFKIFTVTPIIQQVEVPYLSLLLGSDGLLPLYE